MPFTLLIMLQALKAAKCSTANGSLQVLLALCWLTLTAAGFKSN